MNPDVVISVAIAFLVALAAPFALRPMLSRAGVLDVPNARSSHSIPVLRGGGLAQACAIVLALGYAGIAATGLAQTLIIVILATCIAAAVLGWFEDLHGLPITIRAGFQFFIGIVATTVVAANTSNHAWWGLMGGVALLGLINVVNFMDGVNAISALHGIVAGGSFVVIGSLHEADWLVISGAVLAVAFAAFLPWNLSGRMFLGDVGSYLLGGAIAIVVTVGWMQGLPIIALAAPMSIYVADAGVTLLSRICAGEQWYEAHRDHTYQRLNRSGFGHVEVASMVATLSLISAALGIGASETNGAVRLGLLSGIALLVLAYTAARFILASPDTLIATEKNPS